MERLQKVKEEMKKEYWVYSVLALALLFSCSGTKQKEVGKYVYVGCYSTVHVDRECASKLSDNQKTKEERMVNMMGVNFVDTCELSQYSTDGFKFKFCPKCIDDYTYKHLQAIMDRNEGRNRVKAPLY